jgi:hypothetical protein
MSSCCGNHGRDPTENPLKTPAGILMAIAWFIFIIASYLVNETTLDELGRWGQGAAGVLLAVSAVWIWAT